MAIGMIGLLFYGTVGISILGIISLFLVKDDNIKKIIFYALSILAMLIAIMGATSQPTNLILRQAIIGGIGFLSVIGIVVYIQAKSKLQYYISYGLTIISIIFGTLMTFSII